MMRVPAAVEKVHEVGSCRNLGKRSYASMYFFRI